MLGNKWKISITEAADKKILSASLMIAGQFHDNLNNLNVSAQKTLSDSSPAEPALTEDKWTECECECVCVCACVWVCVCVCLQLQSALFEAEDQNMTFDLITSPRPTLPFIPHTVADIYIQRVLM